AIADVTAIQCHLEGVDQQLEQRAPRRSRQGPVALPVDRMGLEQPAIEERYRAERAGPAGAPVLGAVQGAEEERCQKLALDLVVRPQAIVECPRKEVAATIQPAL